MLFIRRFTFFCALLTFFCSVPSLANGSRTEIYTVTYYDVPQAIVFTVPPSTPGSNFVITYLELSATYDRSCLGHYISGGGPGALAIYFSVTGQPTVEFHDFQVVDGEIDAGAGDSYPNPTAHVVRGANVVMRVNPGDKVTFAGPNAGNGYGTNQPMTVKIQGTRSWFGPNSPAVSPLTVPDTTPSYLPGSNFTDPTPSHC